MAATIEWKRDLEFSYGKLEPVGTGVRRLVCPNPGPFTLHGTSTYVLGTGQVMVVDPGPAMESHVDALLSELGDERVEAILVTHTHQDHSPAAGILSAKTGAPTYGFGPHGGGRSEVTAEAGADLGFAPDQRMRDGDELHIGGTHLIALYTPGHCSNHLCFRLPSSGQVLTGDHIMAWSTTVVVPPDGHMGMYLDSLRRVRDLPEQCLLPAHGPAIDPSAPFIDQLLAHRAQREAQLLTHLQQAPATMPSLVPRIYGDLDPGLHTAAACSLLAHAVHLLEKGKLGFTGTPNLEGTWHAL